MVESPDALRVVAHLASPLAGDAPRLDGLLEYQMSLFHPKAAPGSKVDRAFPAPPPGEIPIPLARRRLGPWPVALCSAPILDVPAVDGREHVAKRIGVERASLLAADERKVVATTNSWTKSYRLPLRVRRVPCVAWLCVGNQRGVLKLLRRARAIGKKVSIGYGVVARWEVDRIGEDLSWYAPTPDGPLLMATLPVGGWLPDGLIGARRDFGACCPPYWHPDRYSEVVTPC